MTDNSIGQAAPPSCWHPIRTTANRQCSGVHNPSLRVSLLIPTIPITSSDRRAVFCLLAPRQPRFRVNQVSPGAVWDRLRRGVEFPHGSALEGDRVPIVVGVGRGWRRQRVGSPTNIVPVLDGTWLSSAPTRSLQRDRHALELVIGLNRSH